MRSPTEDMELVEDAREVDNDEKQVDEEQGGHGFQIVAQQLPEYGSVV